MKIAIKTTLSICLMAFIFASCASRKNGMATTKVTKRLVSGTWTVSNVAVDNVPTDYNIKNAFNLAPYQDFIGSTWNLYGGYSGKITLTDGATQNIYWSLLNNGISPTFQFKELGKGEKAKNITAGYQLSISNATKTSMTLRSPVDLLSGKTGYIVYTFVKQ